MQKKIFKLLISSLQGSLVIFANTPKKTILEKSKKKNEILASSEILFLFIVETYEKNKKWHMRPLDVSVHWRYLTLSQKVPKNAF